MPDRKVIDGESRSLTDTPYGPHLQRASSTDRPYDLCKQGVAAERETATRAATPLNEHGQRHTSPSTNVQLAPSGRTDPGSYVRGRQLGTFLAYG